MTLYELSIEYEQTADTLHRRIVELERARREAGDAGRLELDGRLRPLRSMYRDTRAIARHLKGYYQERRPARGRGPWECGRRS